MFPAPNYPEITFKMIYHTCTKISGLGGGHHQIFRRGGGAWCSIFQINNFGRTLIYISVYTEKKLSQVHRKKKVFLRYTNADMIYESTTILYWSGRAQYADLAMKLHVFYGLITILRMKLRFSISNLGTSAHILFFFKSKKELKYNRLVDPSILDASRLVHRIYESIEFRYFS